MRLNRFDDRPLYRQLSRALEARISSGELASGARLPPESELAAAYDVHRLTVRQALGELVRRGLIRTVRGRGSFVATPVVPYEIAPGRTASLTAVLESQGIRGEQRLLDRGTVDAPELADRLGCTGRLEVFRQLRSLAGQPWALSTTWLPAGRFPDLAARWDGSTSLHRTLRDCYGVDMERASVTFAAEPVDERDAGLLDVLPGSASLVVDGLNIAADGEPVAIAVHRFRPEAVRFTVALR